MRYGIDPNVLYDSHPGACEYLHTSNPTIKRSRREGTLFGYPAPPYIKLGKASNSKVVYRGQALIEFLDQFQEQANTLADQLGTA